MKKIRSYTRINIILNIYYFFIFFIFKYLSYPLKHKLKLPNITYTSLIKCHWKSLTCSPPPPNKKKKLSVFPSTWKFLSLSRLMPKTIHLKSDMSLKREKKKLRSSSGVWNFDAIFRVTLLEFNFAHNLTASIADF